MYNRLTGHPHLDPLPSRERKEKEKRALFSRPSGERVRVRGVNMLE
jgi:hypothetical protein